MNLQTTPKTLLPIDIVKTPIQITKEHLTIYNANISEKKIGDYNTEKEDNSLLDLLMKWKIYSGIASHSLKEDFVIILDFIKKNFPKLNKVDIDTVIDLSSTGKLELKKNDESFGIFSCSFVGRYLSAYSSQYKSEIIVDTRIKIEKYELAQTKEITDPEEKIENFKAIVKNIWESVKEGKPIFDFKHFVFNYLYLNEIIIIDDVVKAAALEYAKNQLKVTTPIKNTIAHAFASIEKLENKNKRAVPVMTKQNIFNEQARYVVIKYFESIENIEDFTNTITIERLKIVNM